MKYLALALLLAVCVCATAEARKPALSPAQKRFVAAMHARHGFDAQALGEALRLPARADVLKLISRPAEKAMPWHQYRQLFLDAERVQAGIAFRRQHAEALARAEAEYGVPAAIVCAIIGVETYFGRLKGKIPVLESLNTLAFHYPPRAPFFTSELEQFLLLARAEGWALGQPKGSYAGAMGLGQFMPSNYRKLARDFDGDGHVDLFANPTDAIGSVAAYLKHHGWVAGGPLVQAVRAPARAETVLKARTLEPRWGARELTAAGIVEAPAAEPAAFLALDTAPEAQGQWLTYRNFYVLTRYNRSPLYAMAVVELAGMIESGYKQNQRAAQK